MKLRLGLMVALAGLGSAVDAFAFDVPIHVVVDVSYGHVNAGDIWTDNSTHKNARYFNFDTSGDGLRDGSLDSTGWTTLTGVSGAVPFTVLPNFYSATGGGLLQGAHDDAAAVTFNLNISSNNPLTLTVAYADEAYAQLVLLAYAMDAQPAGLRDIDLGGFGPIIHLTHDGCCAHSQFTAASTLDFDDDTDSKVVLGNWVGTAVTGWRIEGEYPGDVALTSDLPNDDDCDGGPNWLRKDYQSEAIVMGLSQFYGLTLWNERDINCTSRAGTNADFDLDLTAEVPAGDPVVCYADPVATAATDGENWLVDLIDYSDTAGCDDESEERSTQWDWWTYLWGMYADFDDNGTVGGINVEDAFDVFTAANPTSWTADADSADADSPYERWEAEAESAIPYAHSAWEHHVDNNP